MKENIAPTATAAPRQMDGENTSETEPLAGNKLKRKWEDTSRALLPAVAKRQLSAAASVPIQSGPSTETPKPVSFQIENYKVLTEIDLNILLYTDLPQCFRAWVAKQGSRFKTFKKVGKCDCSDAVIFRASLKGHEECCSLLSKLSEKDMGMVFVKLCRLRERDAEEEALI